MVSEEEDVDGFGAVDAGDEGEFDVAGFAWAGDENLAGRGRAGGAAVRPIEQVGHDLAFANDGDVDRGGKAGQTR